MAKIKLTKNELKRQKDSLRRFERYLPTLQLKKQQLQMELRRIDESLRAKQAEYAAQLAAVEQWEGVFGEEVGFEKLLCVREIVTEAGNIAGVDIPVFKDVIFFRDEYDLFVMPLWVDRALDSATALVRHKVEASILRKQHALIQQELTVTSQRVNLFEKVKIPEARENIRRIRISLGDQQTAAVVRGKISKKKLMEKQAA